MLRYSHETYETFLLNFCTNHYYGALIRWLCPNAGFVKLHMDGCNRGDPGLPILEVYLGMKWGSWVYGYYDN